MLEKDLHTFLVGVVGQLCNAFDEATPDLRIRALEGVVVALRARPDDEVSPDFGAEVYPATQGVYALAAECISRGL